MQHKSDEDGALIPLAIPASSEPDKPAPAAASEAEAAAATAATATAHLPAVIEEPELPDTSDPAKWQFIDCDGDKRGPFTVKIVMEALVYKQITLASLVFNPGWASDPRTAHLTWMPMREAWMKNS
jgi:hypothetical protein